MLYVGLDAHARSFALCILNGEGQLVKRMQMQGRSGELKTQLLKLQEPFSICYEASCGYGYLYDQLRPLAHRIVVAHPGHLRLIFRSKRKNDRLDARKLATLLLLDAVPAVHVPSVDVRSWRCLIEFRTRIIAKRTRVKNAIRSLLRHHGHVAPGGHSLWTNRGLAWLAHVALPTRAAMIQRDLLVDELTYMKQQLRRVEQELNEQGRVHPGVQLLQTIPGVGPRTSEAVVAYLDDATRFARNKQVGAYVGLVPSQNQSADKNRLGRITRQGPASVRRLLVEAAWQSIRRSSHVRSYFENIQRQDTERKKIAVVATAHYLVRVMQAMLRTGEAWRWSAPDNKAA